MITVRAVRIITLVICVAGIVGMIVTSVTDHNGAAITFGLVTAVAILCSMVAKAVAAGIERQSAPLPPADDLAELVETHVSAVVASGASEPAVRQLVGEAVRLGRALGAPDS